MRIVIVLGLVGAMCGSGCASTSEGVALMQPESTGGVPSVLVGPARVIDAGINPSVGVRMLAEGGSIVVRFAHPGRQTAVARLDSTSLDDLSLSTTESRDHPAADERPHPTGVDGDRLIMCWKTGDFERGYRAVAQAFNAADGTPRGSPIFISPPGIDVIGTPRSVAIDGHRAIATFEASTGEGFALFAVSIEAI